MSVTELENKNAVVMYEKELKKNLSEMRTNGMFPDDWIDRVIEIVASKNWTKSNGKALEYKRGYIKSYFAPTVKVCSYHLNRAVIEMMEGYEKEVRINQAKLNRLNQSSPDIENFTVSIREDLYIVKKGNDISYEAAKGVISETLTHFKTEAYKKQD